MNSAYDMQAVLMFDLPEEEAKLRAAMDGMDHLWSIRDFQERLRDLNKYGHKFKTIEEAIASLYDQYCDTMQSYLQ